MSVNNILLLQAGKSTYHGERRPDTKIVVL